MCVSVKAIMLYIFNKVYARSCDMIHVSTFYICTFTTTKLLWLAALALGSQAAIAILVAFPIGK